MAETGSGSHRGGRSGRRCGRDAERRVAEVLVRDNAIVRYMNLQDYDHSLWNLLNGRCDGPHTPICADPGKLGQSPHQKPSSI
ncbi:MAG: hypothetical protein R2856_13135 [Caldilineaceae bacterium]